jgi:hypothetical protein
MHATSDQQNSHCAFVPGGRTDVLGSGFLLQITVAPSTQIAGVEQPVIWPGDTSLFAVESSGSSVDYVLCEDSCNSSATTTQRIASDTWHVEGFSSNIISLYWAGSGQPLTVSVNGQQVTSTSYAFNAGNGELWLGAPKQGEALFTHMNLYSAG